MTPATRINPDPADTAPHGRHPAVLTIDNLRITFDTPDGPLRAVDGLCLRIPFGKTVALVGESGCGKSATALSILRLLPSPPATITADALHFSPAPDAPPVNLVALSERRMSDVRGRHVAMIFQDPLSALNPVFTVGNQIIEAIRRHRPMPRRAARKVAVELLDRVGIREPDRRIDDSPHQLSGGMRQRVMIAMALSCRPALLIADEPTTALDVTVQAQILDLLRTLQAEMGMSLLLITHDFGVVAEVADEVHVMYAGRIVEHAAVTALFADPLHPYTRGLIACLPTLGRSHGPLPVIPGQIADPLHPPAGCRFHPRCPLTVERAASAHRETIALGPDQPLPPEPRASARANATSPTNRPELTRANSGTPTEPTVSTRANSRTPTEPTVSTPADSQLTSPTRVLRRCVESFEGEPSGPPPLREMRPGHFVACWEADRNA